MQIDDPIAGANAGAIGQHIIVIARSELNAKQALGRTGVFDHPVANPQPIVQCCDHRFQPRELPNVPALKIFDAGFHKAVRAPHLKTSSLRESFVAFLT